MATTPISFPSYVLPRLNAPVLLFTLLVSALVALALGVAPFVQCRNTEISEALKQNSGRAVHSRGGRNFRNALIVTEISLSMLLLIGAGLLIRSMAHLATLDPGYDPSHILTLRVSLPRLFPPDHPGTESKPDAQFVVTADELLRRISQLPAVQSASIANDVPLGGSNAIFYTAEGQAPMNARTMPRAYFHRVSTDFFQTLRISFVVGRAFSEKEFHNNADVAIVTESLVKRFWSSGQPIGKRIKVGGLDSPRPWLSIIGVVKDLKYRGLPENPTTDPDLFQVFNERSRDFSVLVRASREIPGFLSSVRDRLRQVEPSIVIYDSAMLEELISHETATARFTGWLMAIFAGIALLLAVIGIYGVMSFLVSRRTREIGLRVALGAERSQVLRMIIGRGMALVFAGLVVGTGAALVFTRLIRTLLYGVNPNDPLSICSAALLLAGAAFVACLAPAARATRIDPAVALRSE